MKNVSNEQQLSRLIAIQNMGGLPWSTLESLDEHQATDLVAGLRRAITPVDRMNAVARCRSTNRPGLGKNRRETSVIHPQPLRVASKLNPGELS